MRNKRELQQRYDGVQYRLLYANNNSIEPAGFWYSSSAAMKAANRRAYRSVRIASPLALCALCALAPESRQRDRTIFADGGAMVC